MVVMVVMVVGGGRVLVLMVFSPGRAVASEVALEVGELSHDIYDMYDSHDVSLNIPSGCFVINPDIKIKLVS